MDHILLLYFIYIMVLEPFRFDNKYDFEYDFLVQTRLLTGVCKIVVGSKLVAASCLLRDLLQQINIRI